MRLARPLSVYIVNPFVYVCVCECACVRVCVIACVCVRACVRVRVRIPSAFNMASLSVAVLWAGNNSISLSTSTEPFKTPALV